LGLLNVREGTKTESGVFKINAKRVSNPGETYGIVAEEILFQWRLIIFWLVATAQYLPTLVPSRRSDLLPLSAWSVAADPPDQLFLVIDLDEAMLFSKHFAI
jgi:hypothetical protein